MTDERPGERERTRYIVHLRDARGLVIGDHATQCNHWLSPKAAVVILAALAASLLGNDTPVKSAQDARPTASAPAAAPARPAPSASPSPSPSPTTRPRPSPTPSTSPSAPALRPALPPPFPAPRPAAPTTAYATPPPKPKPSPSRSCQTRQQYRVNKKGQIWDSDGERIGDVASGTLFFRYQSASYPAPVYDRYYGTVDEVISGSATGYVLRKKLDYVGTVEICD
jgi:hypothetical protein